VNRLQVERAKHHFLDDAKRSHATPTVPRRTSNTTGRRWAILKLRVASEVARWWTEEHGPDPLTCTACRIQNRSAEQPITVPAPGQPWLT
jgi:hypothetical protein